MARGVSRARELALKAREAALQAVAAYNNPLASFKSGTYIVLMHIASTALFHAIFCKRKVKPYFRRASSNRFERVDGRPKTWDLRECIHQYWGDQDNAVAQNLRFFIPLRNLIEHADAPEIDSDIFGECQAKLINFEELLVSEFGEKFALNTSLAYSLQFSRIRLPQAQEAMRNMLKKSAHVDIRAYIDNFRSSLSQEIAGDMAFSYKVFLVPMLANHRSQDSLAIEFVYYDPGEAVEYDKVVAMIKQKFVPVLNPAMLKPSQVASQVASRIAPKIFNTSTHTRAWKYWKVRPPTRSTTPAMCDAKYCQHDMAHGDYLYTQEWVEFLVSELSDDTTYASVRRYRP